MTINSQIYDLIEERRIEELDSTGYILQHKKSGAKICILSNSDENKVFSIGFKTPPSDDTGVPHIIEHSVLCGSKKYPAKDPFVELCKGSLNTFLNAMTYPDKTVYPVASCNDVDFKNIEDVYLDAVFSPNIYSREQIFKQEGWHYELDSAEDDLKYNGVVYNEMKGVFSSADDMLSRYTYTALFPDNEYGNESGGIPEKITELTYEEFLEFHRKYYHPANSYIYLYGNMDVQEQLEYLDREYLSKYEKTEIPSDIKEQKPFDKCIELTKEYAVTEEEGTDNAAYLSYNAVVGTSLDRELYLAFQILQYALISAPGAPVKQALIDAGIGSDVYGDYDNSIYQPIFSIVAKNTQAERKDEFVQIIRDTLTSIVEKGIDKKAILAGINYYEFKYREADFGAFPKGLMYGLQMLDSWLYDDEAPFMHIQANDTFEFIKNAMDDRFFEDIIQEYLLDNTHAAVVILVPKVNMTSIRDEATAKKLAEYKKSLSAEEINRIVEETKALKQYQQEPSTEEELETIPMLKREDIDRKCGDFYIDKKQEAGVTVIHSNMFTNGIAYLRQSYSCRYVSDELIPYLGLLRSCLGFMDTDNYTYTDLFNEININTGGLNFGATIYTDAYNGKNYEIAFEAISKVLYDNIGFVYNMTDEIINTTKFHDYKRLREIVSQIKSRLQRVLTSGGHSAAIMDSMAQFSPSMYYTNRISGISYYKFIEEIDRNFDTVKEEVAENLLKLTKLIFKKENLTFSVTANEEGYNFVMDNFAGFTENLNKDEAKECTRQFAPVCVKTGYTTSSQVQYVARTGNFVNEGYRYNGALKILKVIFGYDYLWVNVRVKGGAYGCMSGFYRNGDSYMVSYRDPNLKKTNEIYEGATEYVKNFTVSDRDMTKYIIGTIGEIDTPLNPAAKGLKSFTAYKSGLTREDVQRERDEILNAQCEDIRALADIVEAILKENHFCVIGSTDEIKKNNELFDKISSLIN